VGLTRSLYERLLRNQGYTPTLFEEGLRQSLATDQLRDGVIASALVTPAELEQLVSLLKQQREVYYLTLPLAQYIAKAKVDDAAHPGLFREKRGSLREP
jgi:peptidyl-prolyl cis-trans isomerase D